MTHATRALLSLAIAATLASLFLTGCAKGPPVSLDSKIKTALEKTIKGHADLAGASILVHSGRRGTFLL